MALWLRSLENSSSGFSFYQRYGAILILNEHSKQRTEIISMLLEDAQKEGVQQRFNELEQTIAEIGGEVEECDDMLVRTMRILFTKTSHTHTIMKPPKAASVIHPDCPMASRAAPWHPGPGISRVLPVQTNKLYISWVSGAWKRAEAPGKYPEKERVLHFPLKR